MPGDFSRRRSSKTGGATALAGVSNPRGQARLSCPKLLEGLTEHFLTIRVRQTIVGDRKEEAQKYRCQTSAKEPPPGITCYLRIKIHAAYLVFIDPWGILIGPQMRIKPLKSLPFSRPVDGELKSGYTGGPGKRGLPILF
jgi:hypothetical protein